MVARQQFKINQLRREYGAKKDHMIMSIIDLHDGRTSLEKDVE